ncbi:MAG: hypothetical protein EP329_04530 [Deltaproteobacteria bacterium]|nr:MAG: hypothetical protein EP329_04530 [Deltaproteobacteria bacterium]
MIARTWLSLALLALGACSNPVDDSENKLPYLSERDTAVADDVDATDGGCGCLAVGQWYRFDALVLTSLDGGEHNVIETLNGLWAADISHNELNIMLEVTAVSDSEVTFRGAVGARVDGTEDVCVIDASSQTFVFPRSGCSLGPSAPASINVYAGTETYPKNCSTTLPVKHAIPVDGAVLEGRLDDACEGIHDGDVPAGVLGQADLGQICTCLLLPNDPAEKCGALDASYGPDGACPGCNDSYQSLSNLLTAFGEVSWSCQTTTGNPATCLTATFSAARLADAPASCPE